MMVIITIIVAIMMVIAITIAIWPEFLSPLASAAPAAPARWRPPACGDGHGYYRQRDKQSGQMVPDGINAL